MPDEHVLKLGRRNVLATADDRVIRAAGDEQVAPASSLSSLVVIRVSRSTTVVRSGLAETAISSNNEILNALSPLHPIPAGHALRPRHWEQSRPPAGIRYIVIGLEAPSSDAQDLPAGR